MPGSWFLVCASVALTLCFHSVLWHMQLALPRMRSVQSQEASIGLLVSRGVPFVTDFQGEWFLLFAKLCKSRLPNGRAVSYSSLWKSQRKGPDSY